MRTARGFLANFITKALGRNFPAERFAYAVAVPTGEGHRTADVRIDTVVDPVVPDLRPGRGLVPGVQMEPTILWGVTRTTTRVLSSPYAGLKSA